jgi:hypothetical protein
MQDQISSSFMESPPPPLPHLDGPFFGSDLLPSARLRRMRGYRPTPGGLEEEVQYPSIVNTLHQYIALRLLAHFNRIYAFPPSPSSGETGWCAITLP